LGYLIAVRLYLVINSYLSTTGGNLESLQIRNLFPAKKKQDSLHYIAVFCACFFAFKCDWHLIIKFMVRTGRIHGCNLVPHLICYSNT